MKTVTLGKTGITVPKQAFGALPIQRVSRETAVFLLRKAYDGGMRFFDTARSYTDRESKLGEAFGGIREKLYISTKLPRFTPDQMREDMDKCLSELRTDYVDIIQLHNPPFCPKPGDGSMVYETLLAFKKEGKVRHIGITNHRLNIAKEAIESGLYETLQFPFSYLATEHELELVKMCKEHDMGFIAMKGMAGGTITNGKAAAAFMDQFDNVLPIWGVQAENEIDEFISYINDPPAMTDEIRSLIEHDKKELNGSFCRGCGYCEPCPMGIEIHTCARMSLLLRRSRTNNYLSETYQKMMSVIENCIECGSCKSKCPYGLDTPNLLKANYEDYQTFLAGKA